MNIEPNRQTTITTGETTAVCALPGTRNGGYVVLGNTDFDTVAVTYQVVGMESDESDSVDLTSVSGHVLVLESETPFQLVTVTGLVAGDTVGVYV